MTMPPAPSLPALIVLATCLAPVTTYAQSSAWEETVGARVRIVVEPPRAEAEHLRGMLEVALEPGWKTYWRDPGASGIPPQMDVAASSGLADVRIMFPAPTWISDPYGNYAGYEAPVAFPFSLTRTANGDARLVADVFLGVCEEICIPVQVTFDLDVATANGSTLDALRVAEAHRGLPGAPREGFGLTDGPTPPEGAGVIAVDYRATKNAAAPEVFVYAADGTRFRPPRLHSSDDMTAIYIVEPVRPSDAHRDIETIVTVTSAGDSFEAPLTLNIPAAQ